MVEFCSNSTDDNGCGNDNNNNMIDLYLVNTSSLAAEVPMPGMAIYGIVRVNTIVTIIINDSRVKEVVIMYYDC